MPHDFKLSRNAALLAAVSACYPLAGTAAPVASVDFAAGNVSAVSATGQARPLAKGAEVNEGETVSTRDGRAQLRFTDGAQVSLQPQTDFKIEEYRYAGKPDGSEKGFFNLIRGGLRTITGAIGRTNRQSYQVKTAVATIGIRGTSYSLRYVNSVEGNVGDGSIGVCNNAGCETFSAGESFYVADGNTPAQQTYSPFEFGTQSPHGLGLGGFVSGQVPLLQGAMDGAALSIVWQVEGCCGIGGPLNYPDPDGGEGNPAKNPMGRFNLNNKGELVSFADGNNGNWVTTSGSMVRQSFGNDGVIAWGTWMSGATGGYGSTAGEPVGVGSQALKFLHYVGGIPTSAADMASMQIANFTATYTFMGGTSPTQGSQIGTLNSASLVANFGTFSATAGISATVGGLVYTVSGIPIMIGGTIPAQFSSVGGGIGSGSGCAAEGCSANLAGFFAGRYASRAGFTYAISNALQPVIGAAAFKR